MRAHLVGPLMGLNKMEIQALLSRRRGSRESIRS